MGSDAGVGAREPIIHDFNPRSPHGERRDRGRRSPPWSYFNPRSPHGERRTDADQWRQHDRISIHAPRMGSDPFLTCSISLLIFQSTLPAWGATKPMRGWSVFIGISIHAPRMGSDKTWEALKAADEDFNPRSPHGERPYPLDVIPELIIISIHAPRMGSDLIHLM